MWPNPQQTEDLVTLTEEILNGKLHFLFSTESRLKLDLTEIPNKILNFSHQFSAKEEITAQKEIEKLKGKSHNENRIQIEHFCFRSFHKGWKGWQCHNGS